jgi:P27 family predicted phage terminase small subunit
MPRARKLPGTAVDKRNGARLVSVASGRVERMPAPPDLSAPAQQAWEAFWNDRQAALLTPSSTVVLMRWADALDRYLRCTAEADKEPIVTGSTGQASANPLYKVAEQARATLESCERQLGIGGINAASLGLAAISEAKSLAEMNARYSDAGDEDEDGGSDERDDDPRLRIVDV